MTRREAEMLAADAKDFACLADFVAGALAGTRHDDRVHMSESEADTLLFATLQARLSAAKAFEAIEALMRQEDGQ